VVVLVTLATVFGGGGGLLALASVLFSRAPEWSGPAMGLVALGLGLASARVMRFNADFLRTNRERLVEALAATA
jgi:hypothetical protein